MVKYKSAIIGCGKIGTFFDTPESPQVLTHAKAYSIHRGTDLKGVFDIDRSISMQAALRWNCNSYDNVEQLFEIEQPQIISICVPDNLHYEYLDKLIGFRPKAVISEKPLTKDLSLSKEIVSRYLKEKIPLFVNYPRRYDRTVQRIRQVIRNGEFGRIQHACIKYTKGILHNGSHAIDIANFLFGSALSVNVLSAVIDYSDADPTLNAFLSYKDCPNLFLMAADENCYSIFELDIVGEKKRILFDHFGFKCTEYSVRNDPVFEGYKDLEKGISMDTGLGMSMLNLVENVVNHLEKGEGIICSGEDALQSQTICDKLLKNYFGVLTGA